MAEPKVRFKRDDGSSYPAWQEFALDDILTERNEPHRITEDAPQLSFTIEQGVIYPEDKKSNKRDFLMKDKDNKKFLLTEYNDIIYNPANLKFGAIHRNALGRGVVSPIYAIFTTNQNPEFIEGIVTNPAFIKRSLKYLEGTVEKLKTLKPRDFVKMHVWIPCLEEQQKIADFLSSVDDVISTSEQEVANLETQKKAVMKKIFTQEVRFKRTDGSDFPEWEEMTIGDMGEMHGGLSGKTKNDFGHGDSSFITYMNVYKNPFALPDLLEKVYVKPNERQYAIQYGDVIFTQSSETVDEVGLSSVWMYHNEPYLNSFCMVLRPSDLTRLIPEFVGYLFRSDDVRKQIMLQGQGATRVNLAPSRLVDVRFKYPSDIEEQNYIADFLTNFDKAISSAKKELALWKEMKKGLLQQLFV